MDNIPPPKTEIVYVDQCEEAMIRQKYKMFISPLNKIIASFYIEAKKTHSPQEIHVMFSQILQTRDDLVDFFKLHDIEKRIIYKQDF